MNDTDPKPGVVIDVTPDDETATDQPEEEAAQTATSAPRKRGPVWPIAIALAALGVAIAVGVFGYRQTATLEQELAEANSRYQAARDSQTSLQATIDKNAATLQAQQQRLMDQQALIAEQNTAVEQARTAFTAQEQALADENVRMQAREAELRAAVADVHSRVGRSGNQWIVAEVDYLLRVANHRLLLARDAETARVAMEIADHRLRDTGDPGWTGVREQIARDIAQLAAFQPADLAGLSAHLGALIEQTAQLKVRATVIGAQSVDIAPAIPERERSWETLLTDLWDGFRHAVRIRERDQPIQAMLPPEHEFFMYENLKLQLQAARLALARVDQAALHDHLDTANDWLQRYFEPEDAATMAASEAIAAVRSAEIRPEIPDISQSLRSLQVRMQLMDGVAGDAANAE